MPRLSEYKTFMAERGISSVYKALREYRGWSQVKASIETAMSERTIARIEKGKEPAKDQVLMMDKVYGTKGELVEYWLGRIKLSHSASILGKIKARFARAD